LADLSLSLFLSLSLSLFFSLSIFLLLSLSLSLFLSRKNYIGNPKRPIYLDMNLGGGGSSFLRHRQEARKDGSGGKSRATFEHCLSKLLLVTLSLSLASYYLFLSLWFSLSLSDIRSLSLFLSHSLSLFDILSFSLSLFLS
jgi:hypothetical protein